MSKNLSGIIFSSRDNQNDIETIEDINLIICCECLYKEANWEKLLNTILNLCKRNSNLEVIFSYKKRYSLQELFIDDFNKYFEIEYVPKYKYIQEFQVTDDFIIFHAKLK